MKIINLFSLSILFFALTLVGAATNPHAVIKEAFRPNDNIGPTAEINILIGDVTHVGFIVISENSTPEYVYMSFFGDNDATRSKNLKVTGLLDSVETLMEHAQALASPQDVLDTIKKFATTYNSLEKIQAAQEAKVRSLMKKKWQESDRLKQASELQILGKSADEEFNKELDDILEFHEQTYGKY